MMRSCFACKTTALTLAIVLVMGFLPASLPAQEVEGGVPDDACARGIMDGENADTGLWMAAGCAFGWMGWLAAYIIEPSPPAVNLIGKDSVYTMQYVDCYRRSAKAKQTKAALTGCCIGTTLAVGLNVLLVAASSPN